MTQSAVAGRLAGKTIVQANIQLTKSTSEGVVSTLGEWTIEGEDADASAQFAATDANISGRARTTAAATFQFTSALDGARNARTRMNCNLAAIVEEIAARPEYSGVVTFLLSHVATSLASMAAQDHPSLAEATLTVRYLQ